MAEDLLQAIDREAKPLHLTRSAVIREALGAWLRQREVQRFEERWVRALLEAPDAPDSADVWREAQAWGDK